MKEAYDCYTNSPCQHLKKCIKNNMENLCMYTDVIGCKGLNTTIFYVGAAVHREGYDGLYKRHSNFRIL